MTALGAGFTDVDGFGYADFNASDMAMFCGHANAAIVAAVQAQVTRSTQFLLPTEESVAVAEEPGRRYPSRGPGYSPSQPGGLRAGRTVPGHRKLLGQIIVRHMCATGEPSNPSPSAGCRKFRPTTSSNSPNATTVPGSNE